MTPQLQTILHQAVQAFQSGNLDSADLMLKRVLQIDSKNLPALHILGLIKVSQSHYKEAADYLGRAARLNPNDASIHYNLAKALSDSGNDKDALIHHKKAVALALTNPEAWLNYGKSLSNLGCYEEALIQFDKALGLRPDYAEALLNKGAALKGLKKYEEALIFVENALAINPNLVGGWSNKGVTLKELKRYDEAIAHFDKALSLKPDYAEAYSNKGNALYELKRYDEAIAYFDKALSLKPDYPEAWSNKGSTLHELIRYEEAIAHYDKALSLKPDYAEGWSNKGVTLNELKRYDEAIAHYDKALSLKPDHHEASWNKSLSLLLQGDFDNGLPLYESRWYSEKISVIAGKRLFEKPTWLGVESLKDKTILLYGEQGFGDFIQFCRYAKLVADLGAKVILEVPQPLAGLMKDLEGVTQLVIKGKELPFFDYQCPLLSLPLVFKTNLFNIPNAISYIKIDSHPNKILEWKTRLGPKLKPRVGLAWSGNPNHRNDHNRSLLLADILPFLATQFEYVSLQKEVREVDKLTLNSNTHILNFASHLNDFVDTAALIENLDLVISVDTSVAHLSGALGKKVWTLLQNVPDWRWLLDREDSPWYPSMKLYRQISIGDWNGVLDRVKSDLSGNLDL